MSTSDPTGTEAPAQLPAVAATTPGLSPAGARVPTAPTLPAPDPMSLSQAVAKLANELFTA